MGLVTLYFTSYSHLILIIYIFLILEIKQCSFISHRVRSTDLETLGQFHIKILFSSSLKFSIFEKIYFKLQTQIGFSDDSGDKKLACNARDTGDAGSIPGSRRSTGEGNATHSSMPA